MVCKICGKDTVIKEGDRYICQNCRAVAVEAENTEAIEQLEQSNESEQKKKKSPLKETLDFCFPIVIALIIAIVLKTFIFANAVIPTGSMLNTIQKGDHVIASRIVYEFNDPERYDIVIFHFPDAVAQGDNDTYYVKRVIGLPGETVNIVNGVVYVTKTDGEIIQLEDDFVTACVPTGNYGPYEVPEDSYFVMGDNRNNSVDSRFWETTNYVERDLIIGKVMFRYYPSIGKVE
jgi:signal peptidase I